MNSDKKTIREPNDTKAPAQSLAFGLFGRKLVTQNECSLIDGQPAEAVEEPAQEGRLLAGIAD
ncbi:MAG: hypothetical protein ABJK59_06470 [Erythrobacter sp.]|uniref:hypothetical protein n=1 Tax=Erythrobacter sp. TaxID=1042 RepID=UPI003299A207